MPSSELILNADGSLYHLHLKPGEVADKIILVGDPGRVAIVAQHFDEVELQRQHREFCSCTGWRQGQRLTVLSTGIGPDNIDIVWNELDALVNIELERGTPHAESRSLQALRLGTCGGLQAGVEVGTLVHSRYAIGGDAVMTYYAPARPPARVQALALAVRAWQREHFPTYPLPWYASACDEALDELLATQFEAVLPGITFTATGFYGPQGRALGRIPLALPDLPGQLSQFSFDGLRPLNLEMETASIMALGQALGHRAGAISVVLANRAREQFHPDPSQAIEHLIEVGLQVMLTWETGAPFASAH